MLRKLKDIARTGRKALRRMNWRTRNAMNRVELAAADFEKGLDALGIEAGDIVFAHSALSALGYVAGGAKTIVDTLVSRVGKGGTVLMPTYPLRGTMLSYLTGKPVYRVASDPSRMGAITEYFRRLAPYRSMHPTHAVSAKGADAEWFTSEHHIDDSPFGPHSPFQRAFERDAKILCIGSDIAHVTIYHIVEELTDFPKNVYVDESFTVPVIVDERENTVTVKTRAHDPAAAKFRIEADPETQAMLEREFSERGILESVSLGKGTLTMLRAKPMIDLLIDGVSRGMTIYGDLNRSARRD